MLVSVLVENSVSADGGDGHVGADGYSAAGDAGGADGEDGGRCDCGVYGADVDPHADGSVGAACADGAARDTDAADSGDEECHAASAR